MNLNNLLKEFEKSKNPSKAKILSRFFKTGKGQYGEGDIFLGLTVPEQRALAKKYVSLSFSEIQKLIDSKIHEHRLTGLIILTYKYEKANDILKKEIFDFYLKNTKKVNNWDLVDVTCPRIVGEYLLDKKEKDGRKILYTLSNSKNLWEKRISIVSTYTFIRNHEFRDTLELSEILMHDKHDLIHKAVGWMLREVGKKNEKTLKDFLDKHSKHMPRTMLRYAIERLSEKEKKYYMSRILF